MSGTQPNSSRAVRGTIRRRLLVNAVVDPEEAAQRLPIGLRPHVTPLGTVVGCCLLDIEHIRPANPPAIAGVTLRAAAHRISVEWESEGGGPTVGVYVPMRQTDSRLAVVLGGRWFPGVHEPAKVQSMGSDGCVRWAVDPQGREGYRIRVDASVVSDVDPMAACEPVAGACVSADIGLSPDHHGVLEAACMEPDHRSVREVVVNDLDSAFLSSFTSARVAPSYLMADVGVTWTRATAPALTESDVPDMSGAV